MNATGTESELSTIRFAFLPLSHYNQAILHRKTSWLNREVYGQVRVGALDGRIVPKAPPNFHRATFVFIGGIGLSHGNDSS
jgi:hypothetical protein